MVTPLALKRVGGMGTLHFTTKPILFKNISVSQSRPFNFLVFQFGLSLVKAPNGSPFIPGSSGRLRYVAFIFPCWLQSRKIDFTGHIQIFPGKRANGERLPNQLCLRLLC